MIHTAEVATAASLEALQGASAAFDPRLHEARNQSGQIEVAARDPGADGWQHIAERRRSGARCLLSALRARRYTARYAIPLNFVWQIITREINAATDNPLIFGPGEAISGGNFHGEVIGMVMDYLKIALSELGAISERRTFHLTDVKMNAGLPAMLVDNPQAAGLNSGMMMPQYTAASLTLENQHLATPDSIHSLPTSGGKEDHNANSLTAARHAQMITENTAHILAIELYTAMRALDIRMRDEPGFRMGKGVGAAYQRVRAAVPTNRGVPGGRRRSRQLKSWYSREN